MSLFNKILVPLDFSEHSRAALELAVKLARENAAKLQLLHCYQIQPGGISPYGIALPSNYFTDLRNAAAQHLDEWKQKFVPADLECEATLSSDQPSASITQVAEEVGSDLIVLGTRGLSGIKHVLIGSTAERVVRSAPCPVLTVRLKSD